MRFLLLAITLLGSLTSNTYAQNYSDYKWKNRLIIIKSDSKKETKKAQQKLKKFKEQLNERDVIVFTESAKNFSVILIGKDGGQKWRSGPDFKVEEILGLIDSMPMRQREIGTSF